MSTGYERNTPPAARMAPVLARMQAVSQCSDEQVRLVNALGRRVEEVPAKAMLQIADEPIARARYIISGWACRFRQLSDGRRQLFDFILPGEGIGICLHGRRNAAVNIMALNRVEVVDASPLLAPESRHTCPELADCLEAATELDDLRRLDHMVRLGRLTALERLSHLLLELHDRLAVVGQAEDGRFPLPVTQEILADLLGLSVVHVNRTMQDVRRRKLASIGGGFAILHEPEALAELVDYSLASVHVRRNWPSSSPGHGG